MHEGSGAQVPIGAGVLASFFARVVSLSLPIAPYLIEMGGADGAIFQLAVFGDLNSEWRLQWWSEPPPLCAAACGDCR
jgi:hypothetical protein